VHGQLTTPNCCRLSPLAPPAKTQERQALQASVSPKFVPRQVRRAAASATAASAQADCNPLCNPLLPPTRQHLLQYAIEAAEAGDMGEVNRLLQVSVCLFGCVWRCVLTAGGWVACSMAGRPSG
jgi:uncharacterized protein YdiU (UPF0061 family)